MARSEYLCPGCAGSPSGTTCGKGEETRALEMRERLSHGNSLPFHYYTSLQRFRGDCMADPIH